MATVTYNFVSRCAGGCHATFDVQVNAGAVKRVTYDIDQLRRPLSEIPDDLVDTVKELLLRVHIANRTRPQLVTEFANPVVITI